MKIVVAGSLNVDLVQPVGRLPRPGETLSGGDLRIVPGGKGGNQAYAAASLGGSVKMVGQVGSDSFAPILLESLQKVSVDVSDVLASPAATGTASILVLPNGENTIIISPGANGEFTPQAAKHLLNKWEPGSILLTQLEIPLNTIEGFLKSARKCRVTTILDPAPARPLPPKILGLIDYLTPNQTEAAVLLGSNQDIDSYEKAEEAAVKLRTMGPSTVIVKLGNLGVVIATAVSVSRVAGFSVEALDSTAAGDTFNGAFAVALAEGCELTTAARFANAAAAISVTRHGAQSSIPSRREVDAFLAAHPQA